MQQSFPYQASPRFGHVAVDHDQKVYFWGGHTQTLPSAANNKGVFSMDVYDLLTCTWKRELCTGPAPLGLDGCSYIKNGDVLYVYGGWNGDMFFRTLHQLDLWKLEWKEVRTNGSCAPSRKARAGMAKWDGNLILFGGFGAIANPLEKGPEMEGMTNELHLFNMSNSTWCRQETSHTPPPCSSFSFVHTGQGKAVKFGGREPTGCTNAVHVLDFQTWDWSEIKPSGDWPLARGGHSTCYWANNLMIIGGRGNNMNVFCDAWVLDITTMEWNQSQVSFSEVMLRRCCHTATVIDGSSNSTVVVIFGGMSKWKETGMLSTVANIAVIDVDEPDSLTLVSNKGPKGRHPHPHPHHYHHHHHYRLKNAPLVSLKESVLESQPGHQSSKVDETVHPRTTESEKPHKATNLYKWNKRRRHSHPAKQGVVVPQRRSAPHDLISRPWVVGKEEIQMTGEYIWRAEREGESEDNSQVAVFRGLRVAAHWIHSSRDCAEAMRELDIFMQVHHPNIVQLIGFTLNNGIIVLSELMTTTLAVALRGPSRFTRPQVAEVGLDVARALNYLHLMRPRPLVHGAVNSTNIYLEPTQVNQWRAKLSCKPVVQLGCTMTHGDHSADAKGVGQDFRNLVCSPQCDVYSFGMVLVEMVDRQGQVERTDHVRWIEADDITKKCTEAEPQNRPSMSTVIISLSTLIK